jgi:hypothetical protein
MASRARKLKTIERRWRERFGEPPCLRTDPDLMLRILEADIRSATVTPSPSWGGTDRKAVRVGKSDAARPSLKVGAL